MPALDEKVYPRFNQMLEELEPEIPNMQDVPRGFMEDMVSKNRLYGERVFVSAKQLVWIEKLHQEFVGDTDHADLSQDPAYPGPARNSDMDDDIPFF